MAALDIKTTKRASLEGRVAVLENEVIGKDHPQGSHVDWKLAEVKRNLDEVDRGATERYWNQGRELDELKERIGSLEEEVLREGAMRRKADLKIAELEKKIAKETNERMSAEYDRIADKVRLERTE